MSGDLGHPLRLGLRVTPPDAATALAAARTAERLGYDLLVVAGLLDPWTVLTWVAARTERITVVAEPHDPPVAAVAARAVASLDRLAGGRVELALTGAGSRDALAVVRGLWDEAATGPLVVAGAHHAVRGAERGPAPTQGVPIWVAGDPALAGREADGWWGRVVPAGGLDDVPTATLDGAARAAGRDPREVRRLVVVPASGEDPVEDLARLVLDAGVSTIVLDTPDADQARRFAEESAPALRDRVARRRAAAGTATGPVVTRHRRERRRSGIDYDAVPAGLTVVEPGDPGYGRLRSTYLRGGAPGLVLRPGSAVEAAEALAWAGTQDVPLGIRSGGHGFSGRSTNDGGIVLDLGRLAGIEVLDEGERLVRVGAGARWGEVADALAPLGWAVTSGDSGGVGVGGLATAGGIGWFARSHGLTIDRVRAAEVVLPNGSVVRASATEHPDLFWALRGAGANVGVVTSLDLAAAEVGTIGWGRLVLDASDPAGLLRRWGAAVEAAPRDLTSFLLTGAQRRGEPATAQVFAVVDVEDPDVIVDRLQPLADVAPLLAQDVRLATYPEVVVPGGGPHAGRGEPVSRSSLVDHLDQDVADAAAALLRGGITPFFQIRSVGGAVADVAPEATAYAHRAAGFSVLGIGSSRSRLDPAWDRLHAHARGLYLSFETDPRPERLQDAFPPATLARLRDVKRRYDPAGVLRDNFPVG